MHTHILQYDISYDILLIIYSLPTPPGQVTRSVRLGPGPVPSELFGYGGKAGRDCVYVCVYIYIYMN